ITHRIAAELSNCHRRDQTLQIRGTRPNRMLRSHRIKCAAALCLVVGFGLVWFWLRNASVREDSMPDHLNLGSVYAGSTIELSARFLTSARKPRIDALFESLVGRCPSTWQPVLSRW